MSIEKKNEQLPIKDKTFLGKKINSPTQLNTLLDIKNTIINKCTICENKNNIYKCIKCQNYYCIECIKKYGHINQNNFKENEFICSNCIIVDKNNDNKNFICYICGNKYHDKNIIDYNVNQEQKDSFKNEFKNNSLSLNENEDNLLLNNNNSSYKIKICNNCLDKNYEIIEKIFNKKTEKSESKKQNTNIIDELTNIISKEKGENNIFNILDNQTENIVESNIKENKNKNKDLFDTHVMNNPEKELNDKKEQNNKEIQINIKKDDNLNKNNINVINNNISTNNILNSNNEIKNDYQKKIENNSISKGTNDNIICKNNNIVIDNKNENSNNILLENINNSSLLNPNYLESNINSFLNMNSGNQNITSANKVSNMYIPHFLTTTSPLSSTQNVNQLIPNINTNNNKLLAKI